MSSDLNTEQLKVDLWQNACLNFCILFCKILKDKPQGFNSVHFEFWLVFSSDNFSFFHRVLLLLGWYVILLKIPLSRSPLFSLTPESDERVRDLIRSRFFLVNQRTSLKRHIVSLSRRYGLNYEGVFMFCMGGFKGCKLMGFLGIGH